MDEILLKELHSLFKQIKNVSEAQYIDNELLRVLAVSGTEKINEYHSKKFVESSLYCDTHD